MGEFQAASRLDPFAHLLIFELAESAPLSECFYQVFLRFIRAEPNILWVLVLLQPHTQTYGSVFL